MGTIRLYQVDFEPTDNFYIEDIESYFKLLPSTSVRFNDDKLNYLKLGLNITLKLPLDQSKSIDSEANYAVITQDDKNYYYFIVGANWTAKKTVKLQLTLDTVQTWFTKLNWSDKTQIIREHRNRLQKVSDNVYRRVIDYYNEGLNPAKSVNRIKSEINNEFLGKFYLAYLSNPGLTQDNTSDPMFIGLFGTQSFCLAPAIANGDVTITLEQGYIYYITDSDIGDNAWIQFTDGTHLGTKFELDTVSSNKTMRAIEFYPQYQGSASWYRLLYYTGNNYPFSFSEYSGDFTTTNYQQLTLHNIRTITKLPIDKAAITKPTNDFNVNITNLDTLDYLKNTEVNAGTVPALFSANFSDFDNSNPRISKIIELPYCPVIVSKNSDTGVYSFNGCQINYGYNILKVNLKYLSQLVTTDSRISELLYLTISNPTAKDSPNLALESKLYSSEFYDFAYYYDTDKMPIRLEDVTPYSQSCNIQINYAQTLSMNSDKQFKFTVNSGDYNQIQPFELYLNCARNTERLVLNSSYADYLKNGYNYDQWTKKQQDKQYRIQQIGNIANAALGFSNIARPLGNVDVLSAGIDSWNANINLANTIISADDSERRAWIDQSESIYNTVDGANVANAWGKAAYRQKQLKDAIAATTVSTNATGLGTIILQSGVNSVISAMQTRSAIAQSNAAYTNKINSTALTPISASGTVPTDLFDNYTNNKLIRFEYTLKADDLTNIWKSFRLTGYSHPVKEVPDFNSRIYSNFVQCNAVFNNDSTEIYKVFLDDIRNRFAAGVTVKHCFNGNYDLKDQFENYETIVFGGND